MIHTFISSKENLAVAFNIDPERHCATISWSPRDVKRGPDINRLVVLALDSANSWLADYLKDRKEPFTVEVNAMCGCRFGMEWRGSTLVMAKHSTCGGHHAH
jgi:hypothetical protein